MHIERRWRRGEAARVGRASHDDVKPIGFTDAEGARFSREPSNGNAPTETAKLIERVLILVRGDANKPPQQEEDQNERNGADRREKPFRPHERRKRQKKNDRGQNDDRKRPHGGKGRSRDAGGLSPSLFCSSAIETLPSFAKLCVPSRASKA